jgi:hypothetical protein
MGRREVAVVLLGRGGGSIAWQFVSVQDFVLRYHVPHASSTLLCIAGASGKSKEAGNLSRGAQSI